MGHDNHPATVEDIAVEADLGDEPMLEFYVGEALANAVDRPARIAAVA